VHPAVTQFAAELSALRADRKVSFRRMAQLAHFSSTTLADATRGVRLPTPQVVEAFAQACGADPVVWAAKRQAAAQEACGGEEDAGPADDPAEPGAAVTAHRPVRAGRLAAAAALLGLGVAIGLVIRAPVDAPASARTSAITSGTLAATAGALSPTQPVANGADPVFAGCGGDAQLLDKVVIVVGGAQIGALELRYSKHCQAGWARTYLYPGQKPMAAWVQVESDGGVLSAYADRLAGQVPIYTDVVLPASGCLRASAILHPATGPAVTATIPCDAPPH
jgi:transcriptional regulator with XRE-family HTH domain